MDFARILARVKLNCKMIVGALTALACIFSLSTMHAATDDAADDAALSAAVCPIVYPVDQSPSARGYHYLFYGNGFFINEQGYLLTAAHVLGQLHGGQPYVLLRQPSGPPQFVRASLVFVDRDHDVAILRATPNPFEGKYTVGFLPLANDWLASSQSVLVASLRPSRPLDAYTLDASVDDRSSGQVFDFRFSQLDKGRPDTELFLFNRQVRLGQSGAPVVSAGSREVVGLIEGQWLRPSSVSIPNAADRGTPGVGAAVPIHYAIALLKQKDISWHTAAGSLESSDTPAEKVTGFSVPAPLSLVACDFPPQALFGGEVVLDSLIDSHGRLVEIRVVRGTSPFLEKVLSAVQSWSFFPAQLDGQAVPARVGITFEFSQFYEPSRTAPVHKYEEPTKVWADRGPLPVFTVEPLSPAASERDGSVILYDQVGPQGQLTSVKVFRDSESLASAALAAVNQWRFIPGRRAGSDSDSAAIVVVAFRHAASTQSTHVTK
jgi:TonB family protein